jgi:hypothetical protein
MAIASPKIMDPGNPVMIDRIKNKRDKRFVILF